MNKTLIFQKMMLQGMNQVEHFAEDFESIDFIGDLPEVYPALTAEHPEGHLDYLNIWELKPGNIRVCLIWNGNSWYSFFHEGTEEALRARFEVETLLAKHDMSYVMATIYEAAYDKNKFALRDTDSLRHVLQLVPRGEKPVEYLSLIHPQHKKYSHFSSDVVLNLPFPSELVDSNLYLSKQKNKTQTEEAL